MSESVLLLSSTLPDGMLVRDERTITFYFSRKDYVCIGLLVSVGLIAFALFMVRPIASSAR